MNIRTVWPYLTTSSVKAILHSVISLSQTYLYKMPLLKIVLDLKKYDSVTPYLMKLDRLSIKKNHLRMHKHIIYKLNLIVFKALKGDAPNYIQSMLSVNQPPTPLHLGDKL